MLYLCLLLYFFLLYIILSYRIIQNCSWWRQWVVAVGVAVGVAGWVVAVGGAGGGGVRGGEEE